jgi:hypothetical protein
MLIYSTRISRKSSANIYSLKVEASVIKKRKPQDSATYLNLSTKEALLRQEKSPTNGDLGLRPSAHYPTQSPRRLVKMLESILKDEATA